MEEINAPAPTPSNNFFSTKNLLVFVLIFLVLILLSVAVTYLILQSKQIHQTYTQPSLVPTQSFPTPTSLPDETANWKTYINSEYGYSLKYPDKFKTQVIAAHSGVSEAPPNARHLYIYDPLDYENYLNRLVDIEFTQLEAYYPGWSRLETTLNGKNATKLTSTKPRVIYLIKIPNKGILTIQLVYREGPKEINDTIDQILSTLTFLNQNDTNSQNSPPDLSTDEPPNIGTYEGVPIRE